MAKRSATCVRMSATLAAMSVQKNARQPSDSFTNKTRIAPPAGRHMATNVLYRWMTFSPYNSNVLRDQPRL